MSIMEIPELEIPELEVYIDKKEVQLLHYYEPETGRNGPCRSYGAWDTAQRRWPGRKKNYRRTSKSKR